MQVQLSEENEKRVMEHRARVAEEIPAFSNVSVTAIVNELVSSQLNYLESQEHKA